MLPRSEGNDRLDMGVARMSRLPGAGRPSCNISRTGRSKQWKGSRQLPTSRWSNLSQAFGNDAVIAISPSRGPRCSIIQYS